MKIYCKKTKVPGRVLSGFLILFFLVSPSASNLLPVKILSRLLLEKPYSSPPCTTGLLKADFSYSPFLKERKESKDDDFNSFLEFINGGGSISLGGNKLQTIIAYEYDSYCGAVRIDNASYGSFLNQHTHRIYSSLWYSIKRIKAGVLIGTLIPQSSEVELTDKGIADHLRSGVLQYGLALSGKFGDFKFRTNIDQQPLHLGNLKVLKNLQPDVYRNFPLLLTLQSAGIGMEYTGNSIANSFDISASRVQNDADIKAKSQMPVTLEISAYRLNYTGKAAHDFVWSVGIMAGGGWCAGYANSLNGINYFLADFLRIRGGQAEFGIADSSHHTLLLECGFASLRSPYGFLNMATFSQWTILHPMAYRFFDTDIFYAEAGFTGSKTIFINNLPIINLSLGVRFFTTHGRYRLSEREIVLFFHKYKVIGEKILWDHKGLLFIPEISVPLNIASVKFNFLLDGIIPVVFGKETKNKSDSTQKGKPKTGNVIGGIKASTTVSIPVNRISLKRRKL